MSPGLSKDQVSELFAVNIFFFVFIMFKFLIFFFVCLIPLATESNMSLFSSYCRVTNTVSFARLRLIIFCPPSHPSFNGVMFRRITYVSVRLFITADCDIALNNLEHYY